MHGTIPEVNPPVLPARPPAGPYLDIGQAQAYTSIPVKTLRKYVHERGLPVHRPSGPGGKMFFSYPDLDDLMAGKFGAFQDAGGESGVVD